MTVYYENPKLRDILATQVMAALVGKSDVKMDYDSSCDDIGFKSKQVIARAARLAYMAADAMLAERSKELGT